MTRTSWFLVLLAAVVLAPFAVFHFVPACDFPSHAAISSVLVRLSRGDPTVSSYFAVNLGATPYYLFYVVAVPLSALAGPVVGAKLAAAIFAALFIAGAWLVLAERRRQLGVMLLAPLLVYNVSFFYGFMASFAGLGPLLIAYWALLRSTSDARRRYLVIATVAGLLGVSAHLVLAPAWAAILAGYLCAAPRQRWRRAMAVACISCAPVYAFLIDVVTGPAGDPVGLGRLYHHLIYYAKQQFQLFDKGAGRAAMYAGLALAVATWVVHVIRSREAHTPLIPTEDRTAAMVLVALVLAYVLVPVEWPNGAGWGLNFRYFPLVGVALLATLPRISGVVLERSQAVAGAAILAVYLVGLYVFWGRFDAATRDFEAVRACMDSGRSVLFRAEQERFLGAWPPVGYHTHAYYVALGGAFDSALYAGAHIPIRAIGAPSRGDGIEGFDYLLVQGERAGAEPPPENVRLLRKAGLWSLYGPAASTESCADDRARLSHSQTPPSDAPPGGGG